MAAGGSSPSSDSRPAAAAAAAAEADRHPFLAHPHRTLVGLTLPVLASLLAEPLTGVADTAFVARLGAAEAAALGVGVSVLSATFWVFNFIGIGTQTEIARLEGGAGAAGSPASRAEAQRAATGRALSLAAVLGVGLALAAWPLLDGLARFMGATGAIHDEAVAYLGIRLLGAPAVVLTMAGMGALRGVQDMRAPLYVMVAVNLLNVLLDPLLIFGLAGAPALGLAGAAWATTVSQWLGVAGMLFFLGRRMQGLARPSLRGTARLLVAGRDIVLRTAALLAFIVLCTRAATLAGAETGAAHQGIRQVWVLTAFLLDAWAYSAQSLVGYFLGAGRVANARRVATLACGWGLATGIALMAGLFFAREPVGFLMVPPEAHGPFRAAWGIAVLSLPLNALAFATDGIHFGTGDYRFLRNAMLLSTAAGIAALLALDPAAPDMLFRIWAVTLIWNALRGGLGVARVWPGLGNAPLRAPGPSHGPAESADPPEAPGGPTHGPSDR